MTPKEKAKELYEKLHYQICNDNGISESDSAEISAKRCAIICVDEILSVDPNYPSADIYYELNSDRVDDAKDFWQSVKTEIEKL